MTVYVFVGPTLSVEEVCAAGGFVCVPPVAQGDVYRAARQRPRALGLIDGYFEGQPSVWHKEILWAMSQGIHVFGSASMGALRAAELHDFGMRGVGKVFQDFQNGILEDDDEVAVLHGPADAGYVALSEPMVNVRATLERAETDGLIAPASRHELERCAKGMFYKDRTWEAVLESGAASDASVDDCVALENWLPAGRVDVKADDARTMLCVMRDFLADDPDRARVSYELEWTDMWDTAIAVSRTFGRNSTHGAFALMRERLLDELRLDDAAYDRAREAALSRMLALREANRQRLGVGRLTRMDVASRLRARLGLFGRADLDRWLADSALDAEDFDRLMEDEARIEALTSLMEPAADQYLADYLRVTGQYTRLAERARRKHEVLAGKGLEDAQPHDAGLTPPQLAIWYFEERLGRAVPEDLDTFARGLGLASRADLYRVLVRELLFSTLGEDGSGDDAGAD